MMLAAMRGAAKALAQSGWKVIVGVTGHDVEPQRDAMHEAIQQAIVGTGAKGFAVTEGENWEGGDAVPYSMDHAGAWETSVMMFAHPDNVDLEILRLEMGDRAELDRTGIKEREGIGGYNPLKYASAELGERIVRFCADRIGRKAHDVLAGRAEPLSKADKAFMDNPGPTDRTV
jgi:creatinine amidohydrolase/Fe(II)-dependent formamide hydrolase-like protein